MSGHDIIVVGASAGGVETLVQLVKLLPSNSPAAIFVVLHIPAHATSFLPTILSRSGLLRATHPENGAAIEPGQIYVAPPDYHLLVKCGYVQLTRGPRENSHRPAIDTLFRSAARSYGTRVVDVILSGVLDDGTAGLMAVKLRGGVAVVQDPSEAAFIGMPRSAIENVDVDHVLPVSAIAPLLVRLAQEPVDENRENPMSREIELEADAAEIDPTVMQSAEHPGTPSDLACPDCGGVLWEMHNGNLLRFRCRTGHAFSPESLLAQQSESLEEALWAALRALEERADLARRMAKGWYEHHRSLAAQRFKEQAEDATQRATIIRQVLSKGEAVPTAELSSMPEKATQAALAESARTVSCVVAIAASAGGLKALSQVLSALPSNFPAAITVVQHLDPKRPSLMVDILKQRTRLRVKQADAGEALQPSTIYIAPPNKHLLVNQNGILELSNSQLVHFVRPSADLLFESVAASFKECAIAVVLSGTGRDGARGIQAIKEMGGKAIAQDEATAEFFGMPSAAIDTGTVDKILPLDEIASALINLLITREVG